MPEEIRKIVFDGDELYEALINFSLHAGTRIPQGSCEEVKVKGSDMAFVVLAYGAVPPDPPKSISFTKDQVGASLIAFCREQRVPMPKKGQKVLKVENGRVVYLVRVTGHPVRMG